MLFRSYTSSRTSVALGIRLDDVTLDVFPLALGFWERRAMNDNHHASRRSPSRFSGVNLR